MPNMAVSIARTIIVCVAFVAVWWLGVALFHVPVYILPSPIAIGPKLLFLAQHASLATDIFVTLSEILEGFAIGALAGIALGLFFIRMPKLERLAAPLVLLVQTAPKIAIAPLLLLWLGLGAAPKVILVAIIVLFPTMVGSMTGFRSIDPSFHDLAKILKLSQWQRFWRIELPFAAPAILASLRIATTQAVTAAVIGELMGSNRGLGYLLEAGQENNDTATVIGIVLVLSLLGWIFYELVRTLERRALRWHNSRLLTVGE